MASVSPSKVFEKWNQAFRAQDLFAFNGNAEALLWLKVRAVCRARLLKQFLVSSGIALTASRLSEQNVELFEYLRRLPNAMELLDRHLRVESHNWYQTLGVDESQLKEDLYKVQHYSWGGDQNNSLDKHLVSRYVKVISKYDELQHRRNEIAENAWNYVQNSWYNNWTSYLIEALFKRHPRVVSAIGEIKNVDFFIDDYAIDLKVTFLPHEFLDAKLKETFGCNELSWLKKAARERQLHFDRALSEAQLKYVLMEKLMEAGHSAVIEEMHRRRREILLAARNTPMELMEWLYANQGEMRFGAENRLFIILVNSKDMAQSWKMKRAFQVMEPKIKQYLDDFNPQSLQTVHFTFKGKSYRSLADAIFVIQE